MQPIPDTTIPAPIPPEVMAEIDAALDTLETKLAPYLRSLTDEQRRGLPKMGEDSVEFVQNGERAIEHSLDYMPRSFEAEPFKNALQLAQQLAPVELRLQSLERGTEDGQMLFGSIAYSDALEIYGQLGAASKKDSALLPFYQAMQQRFAKLRGKRTAPAEK